MAEKELREGVKVKIRAGRPFGGREGIVKDVGPTRVTVELQPDGFEFSFLLHDVELVEEE